MNSKKNHDLIFDDVRYKGGFYTDKEVFHTLVKCYRREWDNGVFTGNGMVGVMVYKLRDDVTMWEIGRNDVTAHNMLNGIDWATPRVPIGNLLLKVKDKIISEDMRIHVQEAYISGKVTTEKGSVSYVSYVPRGCDGVYVEITADEGVEYDFTVQPRHGISDRIYFSGKKVDLSLLPPMPYIKNYGDITCSIQEFVAYEDESESSVAPEGALALAWKDIPVDARTRGFYISVQNGDTVDEVTQQAVSDTERFFACKAELLSEHRAWWEAFHGKSSVSLSDEKWDKFYALQMYKLACSTRPDGVVIDSQGPFMTTTTWPTTVWNLNVELSYSPTFISNHTELADSLISVLLKNKQVLIDNAKPMGIDDGMYLSRATSPHNLHCVWPDTYEFGNILWALFTVDRKQRIFPDEKLVRELLVPYLAMSINAVQTLTETDEDGVIHIKDTSSPEYPSVDGANWHPIYDCSYTISLVRWGLRRLIELDREYNIGDTRLSEWEHMLTHLASEPVDENGYRIGRDIPMAKSHRHFSHLMMIFPLMTMNFEDETERALAVKSIEHWLSLEKRLQGYTFTGAAAMMACLGDGDKALEYLEGLEDFLCPNTMYSEFAQVIETPLSAAESIHMMLLHSHGGFLAPFAAVPTAWQDVKYNDLLADGGFSVSAERKNGQTVCVTIKNLVGNACLVRLPEDMCDNFVCDKPYEKSLLTANVINVKISKGESVTFKTV